MENIPLRLKVTTHPHKEYEVNYNSLIGIDKQKEDLLTALNLFFNAEAIEKWKKKHHFKGLPLAEKTLKISPLILLSGEVGCGKTALANSIATPLAKKLDTLIICYETPSDIRGGGHVGEVSAKITAAFAQVKGQQSKKPIILIIDEADDLATNRDQMHAHHEDRAGVNVLIKEIDALTAEKCNIAVLMITNRFTSIDPAVIRRASLQLNFERPSEENISKVFTSLLDGVKFSKDQLESLVSICMSKPIPFSYSDLTTRIAKQAIIRAYSHDKPFSVDILKEVAEETNPSPLINDLKNV